MSNHRCPMCDAVVEVKGGVTHYYEPKGKGDARKLSIHEWLNGRGGAMTSREVAIAKAAFEAGESFAAKNINEIVKTLRCDDVRCDYKRDILASIYEAMDRLPACGMRHARNT